MVLNNVNNLVGNASSSGPQQPQAGGLDLSSLPFMLAQLGQMIAPQGSGIQQAGKMASRMAQGEMYNSYLAKKQVDPNVSAPLGLSPELRSQADQTAMQIQQQQFQNSMAKMQQDFQKQAQKDRATAASDTAEFRTKTLEEGESERASRETIASERNQAILDATNIRADGQGQSLDPTKVLDTQRAKILLENGFIREGLGLLGVTSDIPMTGGSDVSGDGTDSDNSVEVIDKVKNYLSTYTGEQKKSSKDQPSTAFDYFKIDPNTDYSQEWANILGQSTEAIKSLGSFFMDPVEDLSSDLFKHKAQAVTPKLTPGPNKRTRNNKINTQFSDVLPR